MSTSYGRVLCLGAAVLDHVFIVSLEAMASSRVPASDYYVQGGGPAATAAVAVSRLGGRATLVTRIGDDGGGHALVQDLRHEGVEVLTSTCAGSVSPVCAVLVDSTTGERKMATFRGRGLVDETDWLPLERIGEFGSVMIDGRWQAGAVVLMEAAKEQGIPVVLDLDNQVKEPERLIRLSDVVVMDEDWYVQHADGPPHKGLRRFHDLGPKTVGVTLGAEGSYFSSEGKVWHQAAFKVNVRDTTGAGDVFHGACAFGVAMGWELEYVARFASAVAALKCSQYGSRRGIPCLPEALRFLEEHPVS